MFSFSKRLGNVRKRMKDETSANKQHHQTFHDSGYSRCMSLKAEEPSNKETRSWSPHPLALSSLHLPLSSLLNF